MRKNFNHESTKKKLATDVIARLPKGNPVAISCYCICNRPEIASLSLAKTDRLDCHCAVAERQPRGNLCTLCHCAVTVGNPGNLIFSPNVR